MVTDHGAPDLWRGVVDAAAGHRHATARTVTRLATVGDAPRLAWVLPPRWPQVARALAPFAAVLRARRVVVVSTGGWAFGARALAGAGGSSSPLRVIDVLDPERLAAAARTPDGTAVIAISESGRTIETVTLATALRDRWGLAARWLTAGQLSLDPTKRTVALFAAPLSVPFLLMAAVATRGHGTGLDRAYPAFADRVDAIGRWAAVAALRIPPGRSRVRVDLPPDSGDGLALFAGQALRQGIGGKRGAARPWLDVRVVDRTARTPADVVIALPDDTGCPHWLVRLMARCYAICALVACTGVRHRIAFATHPAVDRYKDLMGGTAPAAEPVEVDHIVSRGARWLRRRRLVAGHLVCYEPRLAPRLAAATSRLADLSGRPWETHTGSTWNHHSYQAVSAEAGVGVVAAAPAPASDPLLRVQADIARATCAALGDRALLLQPRHRGQEATP